MSDQFTEVTVESWGQRIAGGFVAMVLGFLLLPTSIGALYWNEGRAVTAATALSRAAGGVIEADPNAVDVRNNGKLIHLIGMVQPATPARDPLFGVSAAGLVRLARTVQTFQWQQSITKQSAKNLGGSKTTQTTYTYNPVWSAQAINSGTFRYPQDHQNPPPPFQSATFNGGAVTLGAYSVGPELLRKLNAFTALRPEGAAPPDGFRAEGDGFYSGADPSLPQIGDVRVSFSAVPAQTVSVAAAQSDRWLTAFQDTGGYSVLLVEPGVVTAAALFDNAAKAASRMTWIIRGAGCLGVFMAFILMSQPVAMLLAVLPFLESMAETGAFVVATTMSIPITIVTIAAGWFVYRPLLGVCLLVAAVMSFLLLRRLHPRPAARA